MKCVVCRNGETRDGSATVVLEADGATVVVRGVPAQICINCGEEYVAEDEATGLLQIARGAKPNGNEVDVRDYLAA